MHTVQAFTNAPREARLDAAVAELFLAAVTPAQVDVALRALDAYEAEAPRTGGSGRCRSSRLTIRSRSPGDGTRRLIRPTGWSPPSWRCGGSRRCQERERLKREAEKLDRRSASPLGTAERRRVREMAADLGKVWHAATTGMEDRKEFLQFLVHRVYLDGVTEAGRIRIEVEWHTERTMVTVPRPAVGA